METDIRWQGCRCCRYTNHRHHTYPHRHFRRSRYLGRHRAPERGYAIAVRFAVEFVRKPSRIVWITLIPVVSVCVVVIGHLGTIVLIIIESVIIVIWVHTISEHVAMALGCPRRSPSVIVDSITGLWSGWCAVADLASANAGHGSWA